MNSSNSTQVVLKQIDFPLSGNFSCEVTTDVPISTGTDTQEMLVVRKYECSLILSHSIDKCSYQQ